MKGRKLFQLLVVLAAFLSLVSLTGCGITEEQYQQVCAERDALQAELQELKNGAPLEEENMVQAVISGTFTATVRALIPDYVTDGTTPRAAVVTLFQRPPFIIMDTGEFAEQLEAGETYVFEVRETAVEITREEYEVNFPDPEVVFPKYDLRLSGFRESVERDWGLDSVHLVYEKCDSMKSEDIINE